ncbi:hypothetical protein Sjap_003452 [Stephania japonica]|uniref:U-box domain-containing protein n=1 Tax=Stephania japonica TaxID=461633 RepID=A0AAP0KQV7_9MAGN
MVKHVISPTLPHFDPSFSLHLLLHKSVVGEGNELSSNGDSVPGRFQVPDFTRDHVRPSHPVLRPHLRPSLHPTVAGLRQPHLPNYQTAPTLPLLPHPQPRPPQPHFQLHPSPILSLGSQTSVPTSTNPTNPTNPNPHPDLPLLPSPPQTGVAHPTHPPLQARRAPLPPAPHGLGRRLRRPLLRRLHPLPRLRESALALLLNLSLDDDGKVGLVAEGAIAVVVDALLCDASDNEATNCRAYAATVLTSLAMLDVNKGTIGAFPCAISLLVSLLRDGSERERREAATALFVLCSFDDNKRRAVECGAVAALVELGGVGVERALGVLSLLGKCREGREEMGRNVGVCVGVLVGVLRGGVSARSLVYALSALNSLCSCGGGGGNGGESFGVEVIRHGGWCYAWGWWRMRMTRLVGMLRHWFSRCGVVDSGGDFDWLWWRAVTRRILLVSS